MTAVQTERPTALAQPDLASTESTVVSRAHPTVRAGRGLPSGPHPAPKALG
ncbi:hypothetical protein SALBM217S_01750 [Streptomyces griseoloalbus]|uniref:Uncharacterized protein n=1 Tax=Streptomyces pseudogriseolus TaxID=36817 RepID=A0ABQ2T5Q3_STREZ|nr:hypothetical protein GCM10010285_37360 [Streptomyces rubiginosus]